MPDKIYTHHSFHEHFPISVSLYCWLTSFDHDRCPSLITIPCLLFSLIGFFRFFSSDQEAADVASVKLQTFRPWFNALFLIFRRGLMSKGLVIEQVWLMTKEHTDLNGWFEWNNFVHITFFSALSGCSLCINHCLILSLQ